MSHETHCNMGEYEGSCKYGDPDCPELDDWGCDHCRNDGKLTPLNTCPKCDAYYDD